MVSTSKDTNTCRCFPFASFFLMFTLELIPLIPTSSSPSAYVCFVCISICVFGLCAEDTNRLDIGNVVELARKLVFFGKD